jgi:ketosteroid isomerase-like protein
MKSTLLRLLPLLALFTAAIHAADDKLIAAVRAADDERIAATQAADAKRLDAIYSDALHYAHSSGKVDTKASQIKGITTSGNKYEKFEHKERTFIPAGPGIVLMKGRILMHMSGANGKVVNDLNYLAVWREEQGKWRFLAWQSCKNPPAVEAPAGAKVK